MKEKKTELIHGTKKQKTIRFSWIIDRANISVKGGKKTEPIHGTKNSPISMDFYNRATELMTSPDLRAIENYWTEQTMMSGV